MLLIALHSLGLPSTVWLNDRDVSGSGAVAAAAQVIAGLGGVLLVNERRLIRALQRTVGRWADKLPGTARIPLPIPAQGVTWWLTQVFQALGFAVVVLVMLNLLLAAGLWGVAMVTGSTFSGLLPGGWIPVASVYADPEGVSVQFQWGCWALCTLAGAGHLLWRWQQVRRAGTAAS